MEKIKLFCIPYAGSSTFIYLQWKDYFKNSNIEVIPIELAGRGKRSRENFYEDIEEAIDDIYILVKEQIQSHEKFAFFGHSMGALLAYETICKMRKNKDPKPLYAFFSGRYPPHVGKKTDRIIYKMPEAEFLDEMKKIGGFRDDFFQSRDLINQFLPILRGDYRIIENYYFAHDLSEKMDFDIMIFNGREDKDVCKQDLLDWNIYSNKNCTIKEYEGGHFFLLYKYKDIINDIINALEYSNAFGRSCLDD